MDLKALRTKIKESTEFTKVEKAFLLSLIKVFQINKILTGDFDVETKEDEGVK